MKTSKRVLIFCVAIITFYACNKEGPMGPTGAAGPQGPAGATGTTGATGSQGVPGNANVVQYTYNNSYDFTTATDYDLQVTTTADTMNRSLWFVYLKYNGGFEYSYALPGFGYNAASFYRSSFYYNWGVNKVVHTISKVNGPGEVYNSARIVRVYANTTTNGGRMALPKIDFTNYNAVRKYYNLPE